jgi:hypothetical protein
VFASLSQPVSISKAKSYVSASEVCGYSVMSNHLHLVLRNRPDIAEQWSDDEIALRWRRVFRPRDDATCEPIEPTEHDLAIEDLSRLARQTRGPGSSRRGESFNFPRQVITQTRRSSR